MTNTNIKRYYVGVIERAIAYYDVEAATALEAAENWQDGEFSDRDDEALESEGPCSVREQQPNGSWRKVPASDWDAAIALADAADTATFPDLPTRFDAYEIHGVREYDDGTCPYCEQVPDAEAQFWSLFGHIPREGVMCIGDFQTRKHAEEVFARITGRRYTGQVRENKGQKP